jgi:hypothetical protein
VTRDDVLQELFDCERFVNLFPEGMPLRACLRRQDERRTEVVVLRKARPEHGIRAKTENRDAGPVHPFCATECELGRANRARVDGAAAAATPRAGAEEQARPGRIWSGEVPEVPIGGPPGTGAPERAMPPNWTLSGDARRRETKHETPATPAQAAQATTEEDEMLKRKPLECCGSLGGAHRAGCEKAGGSKPKAGAAPAPPKQAKGPRSLAEVAARSQARAQSTSVAVKGLPPVAELPDEYLESAVQELQARATRLREEAAREQREKLDRAARLEAMLGVARAEDQAA